MTLSPFIHSRLAAAGIGLLFVVGSQRLQAQQASIRPGASLASPAPTPAPSPGKLAEAERRIREKLGAVRLERVAFDQADFEQVITYLRTKLKEIDRAGLTAGINILVRTNPKQTPVTIDKRNISMIEALHTCGDAAGYRMRFDESGITFVAAPVTTSPADRALLTELEQRVAEIEAELADLEQRKSSAAVEERLKAVRLVYGELITQFYRVKYGLAPKPATGTTGSGTGTTISPTAPK